MRTNRIYALYKGDEFIDLGTSKELARKRNIKEHSLKFYMSPTYQKRTHGNGFVLIRIDDK